MRVCRANNTAILGLIHTILACDSLEIQNFRRKTQKLMTIYICTGPKNKGQNSLQDAVSTAKVHTAKTIKKRRVLH